MKFIPWQTAADDFPRGRQGAGGVLNRPVLVNDLRGNQVCPMVMDAGEEALEDGLHKNQVWIENRKVFSLRLFERPVVILGKSQWTGIAECEERVPGRRVERGEVVLQVVGQDELKLLGARLMFAQAGKQTGDLVTVAVADDGEGDERRFVHVDLFR